LDPSPVVSRRAPLARVAAGLLLLGSIPSLAALTGAEVAGQTDELTNPLLGDPAAIEEGERIFRSRCTGCHWSPLRAPVLFQTDLSDEKFLEAVIAGRQGNRGNMPPFGYVLSPDDVWKVHAFVMAREGL
jgi:mono/diheme cytochrome c family protein